MGFAPLRYPRFWTKTQLFVSREALAKARTVNSHLRNINQNLVFDELIAIINIDREGIEGRPWLELFGPSGLITRIELGAVPGLACRHYLLSELAPGVEKYGPLTLRLVDEVATLLMSTLHFDHGRQDIALDHGSDRFSTLLEYGCLLEA